MNHSYKSLHLDEFSLIEKYFKNQQICRADVLLGIGDDAALLTMPPNQLLVLSMDTLVAEVHFPSQTLPFDIGYKSLAVNLSDLAAMGAEPAWITLALTMPELDTNWLSEFTSGLSLLANQFNIQLIGGDTTRGPLTITIQAHGFIPPHQALRRVGAKVGDKIYVSGTLGDAGLGLRIALQKYNLPDQDKLFALQRLNRPTPRIQLGILLRKLATSAVDISDGLLADLSHILTSSHVGASISATNIPLSESLSHLPLEEARELALTAGDDYELCFTIPPKKENELIQKLCSLKINCCCIGEIEEKPGLRISGFSSDRANFGFRHF